MNKYRWFWAIFFGVGVHGLLFVLSWPEPATRPPEPLAIQRIAVSLGEKKVVPKKATKKPQKQQKPVKKIIKKQAVKPQAKVKKETSKKPVSVPVISSVQPSVVSDPLPTPVAKMSEAEETRQPAPVSAEPAQAASKETAGLVKQASPLYKLNPPPKYPRLARRRGLQGVVVLDVLVNTSGSVEDVRVERSTGYGVLDKAARKAVRNWQFNVGTVGGIPQQMWVKVPVRFRLQ